VSQRQLLRSFSGRRYLRHGNMILCYHKISDSESGYLYNITPALFSRHLELVSELGNNSRVPPLSVTFDDGHVSAYLNGLSFLRRCFVSATFFLTVGRIGGAETMSWEQVNELAALGHSIGSHGWSHAFFTRCSDAELDVELRRSKGTLEDKLGAAINSISFPGGRWNSRVLRALSHAGYTRAYCSDPWIELQVREGVELRGRLMVHNDLDCAQLLRLSHPASTSLLVMRTASMLKQAGRMFLGDDLYLALWRKLANSRKHEATP
jgi:peptidoglycan/xylan/chitin deacetylase (PgdA/CDA1 family)